MIIQKFFKSQVIFFASAFTLLLSSCATDQGSPRLSVGDTGCKMTWDKSVDTCLTKGY